MKRRPRLICSDCLCVVSLPGTFDLETLDAMTLCERCLKAQKTINEAFEDLQTTVVKR